MLGKRKLKKLDTKYIQRSREIKCLSCSECNRDVICVGDVAAVVCAYCVQKMLIPPKNTTRLVKSNKPRGWHFKAYFEQDGVVYSRGKVVTDLNEISKLKKGSKNSKSATQPKSTRRKKNARTSK